MTTKYTEDHEWVRQEGNLMVVGITDFAQKQLGEIIFVELPDIDSDLSQGDEAVVVESVKAAGEVKSPIAGVVVEINTELEDAPETVNESPHSKGWLYKLNDFDLTQLDDLMNEETYKDYVEGLS